MPLTKRTIGISLINDEDLTINFSVDCDNPEIFIINASEFWGDKGDIDDIIDALNQIKAELAS